MKKRGTARLNKTANNSLNATQISGVRHTVFRSVFRFRHTVFKFSIGLPSGFEPSKPARETTPTPEEAERTDAVN